MDIVDILLMLYPLTLIGIFFYNPRWSLLLFFSTKFTIDLFWDHLLFDSFSILKVTGVLFACLCVYYFITCRRRLYHNPLWKIILILFIANIIAGTWGFVNSNLLLYLIPHSPLKLAHILDWNLRFINLAGAALVIPLLLDTANDKKLFLRSFLASTLVPSFVSWYQFGSVSINHMFSRLSDPYSVTLFERINATFHDSGTLALVMFTAIAASIALCSIESSRQARIIIALYAIACSLILYFTFSRTLWITTTLLLLSFFWMQKKTILAISVVVIAVLIISAVPSTVKRFEREINLLRNPSQVSDQNEIQKLGAGRLWLWNDARKHFADLDGISKIIGSGGYFGSHNQYIAWLLRNGIIGLTVWLLLLYNVFRLLWKAFTQRAEASPLSAFVFVLFCSVIGITNLAMQPWDNVTFSYFFWGLLGLHMQQSYLDRDPK